MSLPCMLLAAGAILGNGSSWAETVAQVYTGSSSTRDSDLRIIQRGAGTDITLHDVDWNGKPFKTAPYYGLRLARFPDQYSHWGIGIEYTHYKMYADTGRVTNATGVWKGAAVSTAVPMDQYVQHFEVSHGMNMISFVGMYRWASATDRLQPYAGAGLAYYMPHSENTIDNRAHETGYESSGGGYQVLGGVQYKLTPKTALFTEAKFNSGTLKVDIADGRAETPVRTWHIVAGLGWIF